MAGILCAARSLNCCLCAGPKLGLGTHVAVARIMATLIWAFQISICDVMMQTDYWYGPGSPEGQSGAALPEGMTITTLFSKYTEASAGWREQLHRNRTNEITLEQVLLRHDALLLDPHAGMATFWTLCWSVSLGCKCAPVRIYVLDECVQRSNVGYLINSSCITAPVHY